MLDELSRPFGVATHVDAIKVPAIEAAMTRLAAALSVTVPELPEHTPAQMFWTVYRLTNALVAQGQPET